MIYVGLDDSVFACVLPWFLERSGRLFPSSGPLVFVDSCCLNLVLPPEKRVKQQRHVQRGLRGVII